MTKKALFLATDGKERIRKLVNWVRCLASTRISIVLTGIVDFVSIKIKIDGK
jgi:hypothetical protein